MLVIRWTGYNKRYIVNDFILFWFRNSIYYFSNNN
jgi:hypothetical protein